MAFLIQSRRRLLSSSSLYSCTFEHIKSGVYGDRKGGDSGFEQQVHRNYSFGKRRFSGTSDVIGNAGLEKPDVAIIGAGIVGLATAREIVSRYSRATVVVVEKEKQVVPHQTSHNSGVIHAGIYYEPGSAMAKLCVEGAQRMYEYCEKKKLPHKRVGKLIVATQEHELKTLEDLYHRAVANKVQGLELLSPKQIQDMEPNISALRALHSPNTGITDYAAVARSFAEDIIASGRGQIRTRFEVNAIDADANKGVNLQSKSGDVVKAKWLVTCAGLQADYVAQMAGGAKGPTVLPFRGTYHELKPELCNIITRNIYPVPDPRFPMVGVHLTPRVDGRVLIGPNAALSLSKEGYKFWNFNLKDSFLFARNKGLWKLVLGNPVIVLQEVWRDINKGAFIKEANRKVIWVKTSVQHSRGSSTIAHTDADDIQEFMTFVKKTEMKRLTTKCKGGQLNFI